MKQRLDRRSPVPLYHQIAEALRNGIAIGDLAPGTRLPSIRDAARDWEVNLHTVRRAYGELEADGLVRVNGARGTEVVRRPERGPVSVELEAFLDSSVQSAHERFGLDAAGFARLLLGRGSGAEMPIVHFLECSLEQAMGHCEELERAWRVEAKPLVLSEVDELPAGLVVATYFHYNELRQRWPHRLEDVQFVAIAPDSSLPERLPRLLDGDRQRLVVCEFEAAKAKNIAADLRNLIPDERHSIEPRVVPSSGRLPRARLGEVLLVAPRVWGVLSSRQRDHVVHVRYRVRQHELERLGTGLGWRRR